MKRNPNFIIKLSFIGNSLKGNKKYKENSVLQNLVNKKINIHLKINLEKLEQEYKKSRINFQKNEIEEDYDDEIIENNFIEVKPKKSLNNKEIPKEKFIRYKKINNIFNKDFDKFSHSLSNKKMQNINSNKNTLILDLDETLVYVTDTKNNNLGLPQIKFDYYICDESEKFIKENFNIMSKHKIQKASSFLTVRPYFKKFINIVKNYYEEIFVFTSSQYSYAEEIIKIIDKQKIISKIYSRKDCSFYNDIFYKDLNKIKHDLSHVIIIDNYPESYLLQNFNGIPIPPFLGDPKDNELMKLIPILERLSKVKDVRNYIRQIIDYNRQKINFNKAYQLFNLKNEFKKSETNDKLINSYNSCNNKTNSKFNNEDDTVIINNQNNYFYIEKNKEVLANRNNSNFYFSKNKNKINSNKKNKIINYEKFNKNKTLWKEKRYKSLKPQIINSLTIDDNQNNYNEYKNVNNINDFLRKTVNSIPINISCNSNLNYNNSIYNSKTRKNSSNHKKDLKISRSISNKNNYNIFSYSKKPKIANCFEESWKKNLFSIQEVSEKINNTENSEKKKIYNHDLYIVNNSQIGASKRFRKIPIHHLKKFFSQNKKYSLSP